MRSFISFLCLFIQSIIAWPSLSESVYYWSQVKDLIHNNLLQEIWRKKKRQSACARTKCSASNWRKK